MRRQPIDGGGWFDLESATHYEESQHHDGHNYISNATGDQWEHEALYRTRRGVYVLHAWSQWQGSVPSWTQITVEQATEWLVRMGYEPDTAAERKAADAAEV